jgi:hypothetical protein
MLFMVIEHFKSGDPNAVGERFRARGRMMPENVIYHTNWMAETGSCCYQIMEAPDREALGPWLHAWKDLVDFEVVPVLTSADFWARSSS